MTAVPLVVGTAGHIDHGKTSLVRALTGIDTDRLPVEKARGITTELGFARLDLGSRRVAVVDVPGHERFVKSMVAGATGIDLVCLTIAADEGLMPQTREHLDICDLLGVRRGIVVVTKRDLVDDDWLAMAEAEIRTAVAPTFLAKAPIVPVSAKTGAGLDELKKVLAKELDLLPPRAATGVFRLPVDRIFTVKGFGTIVTGTILGGEVKVGDELTVVPSGLSARVRGIEVHGVAVDTAVAGHRAALNLGGVAVDDLARGDLLAHPERLQGSHILDVELRYLGAQPLPARSKALIHHGTAQVLATIALVGQTEMAPGSTGLAQIRLDREHPLGALPGDRFIARGFVATSGGGATFGGGRVIRVLAPRARKGHAGTVAALAGAKLEQRIALEVKNAAAAGLALDDLVRRLGIPPDALTKPLAASVASGELMALGTHYLHATAVADVEARLMAKLPAGDEGALREELRTQLPAALPVKAYDAIVAGLEKRGGIVASGDRLTRSSASVRTQLSPIEQAMLDELRQAGVTPPSPKDLTPTPPTKAALDRLIAQKLVVKVKSDLVMDAATVAAIKDKLVAFLTERGTIDAQGWKDLTGASRKFTIPLAEYFDAEKVTLRIGDVRKLRAQPPQKK